LLNFDRSTVKHGTQNIFGQGSAQDPTVGAYSAHPDPLVGLRGPTSKEREWEGEGIGKNRKNVFSRSLKTNLVAFGLRTSHSINHPSHKGCSPSPKNILIPLQHRPPAGVLRVLTPLCG